MKNGRERSKKAGKEGWGYRKKGGKCHLLGCEEEEEEALILVHS